MIKMGEKFILNYENVKELCKYFTDNHKHFYIRIDRSCNVASNSYYLRFMFCGDTTSLRISDHYTKLTSQGGGIRNIVVKDTRTRAVYAIMCEAASTLIRKSKRNKIDRLFKEIERK